MCQVTFQCENSEDVRVYAAFGENLLEVARRANVAIDAPCSGNGSCGKCKVLLADGSLQSEKTRHISEEAYENGWRLACASAICGDARVAVPDIASAYKSRMKVADLSSPEELALFAKAKASLEGAGISFGSDVELVPIRMDAPTLADAMPDNERLTRAIQKQTGAETVDLPFSVLKKLAVVLRASDFAVQAVWRRHGKDVQVYDIFPGTARAAACGLCVDVGTTTVSALLVDLKDGQILAKASAGNGQIRYGADVINRILESVKPGGSERLQKALVQETLNPMIGQMCQSAGIAPEQIYRVSVAANTTMNHLLCGFYGDSIRREPYVPTFFQTDAVHAPDIGLTANPAAQVLIAPNIGSYVGGDITAGTLVSGIWDQQDFSLLIDLGTNGEIVFGNEEFLFACACSAGPAFEGGEISCGMRATDGAIESCVIDAESMEPRFSVIGQPGTKPVGICGSGIIDVIAELFRCGAISPKGKFLRSGARVRRDAYGIGSYVLAFADEAGAGRDVEINEVDIDNFIRAKGAIFSAIRTMLSDCAFDISLISRVYVAGGIGSGINMKNAIRIGMFPDIPLERYAYIGNSALTGAYAMLASAKAAQKVREVAANMTYLELSAIPTYMDEFVGACFLPHTDAALFPSAG